MEAALPKSSGASTLWECEEVALRYIHTYPKWRHTILNPSPPLSPPADTY